MAGFNMIKNLSSNKLHIVPPLFFGKIKVKAKIICKIVQTHHFCFLIAKLGIFF